MEAAIFCGIQASGKTTFYLERFFRTHVRVSLDLLRTRHRERVLMRACLETQQPFVVDNTNATAAERRPYVQAAVAAGLRPIAYFFDARPREALARNAQRPDAERIPVPGVLGTQKRLEVPRRDEGYAALIRVRIDPERGFVVDDLPEPPPRPSLPGLG